MQTTNEGVIAINGVNRSSLLVHGAFAETPKRLAAFNIPKPTCDWVWWQPESIQTASKVILVLPGSSKPQAHFQNRV